MGAGGEGDVLRLHVEVEGPVAAIAADAARAHEEEDRGARVRSIEVGRALEPADAGGTPFYTLTPYVGCLVGCRFCYAQRRVASVRRLEGLPSIR